MSRMCCKPQGPRQEGGAVCRGEVGREAAAGCPAAKALWRCRLRRDQRPLNLTSNTSRESIGSRSSALSGWEGVRCRQARGASDMHLHAVCWSLHIHQQQRQPSPLTATRRRVALRSCTTGEGLISSAIVGEAASRGCARAGSFCSWRRHVIRLRAVHRSSPPSPCEQTRLHLMSGYWYAAALECNLPHAPCLHVQPYC